MRGRRRARRRGVCGSWGRPLSACRSHALRPVTRCWLHRRWRRTRLRAGERSTGSLQALISLAPRAAAILPSGGIRGRWATIGSPASQATLGHPGASWARCGVARRAGERPTAPERPVRPILRMVSAPFGAKPQRLSPLRGIGSLVGASRVDDDAVARSTQWQTKVPGASAHPFEVAVGPSWPPPFLSSAGSCSSRTLEGARPEDVKDKRAGPQGRPHLVAHAKDGR